MDTQFVKDRMKQKKVKPVDIATELGIDVSTFYRKMKNDSFKATDMNVFKRMLDMSNREALEFLLQ